MQIKPTNEIILAMRPKAWVCGRTLAGISASIPAPGHGCLSVVIVVCYQVEISETNRSLIQRSLIARACLCVCVSLSVIKCNNNPLL
jgi:hypothetical protein